MKQTDVLQPEPGWAVKFPARLTPPPVSQRGLVFRGLALITSALGRKDVPDIFPVLNIHRGLFLPWLWFASRMMPFGKLPARERELLILRTSWHCRCRYEWGQHVDIALTAGVSDEDIVRIARGPQAFADQTTRALVQACDDLCLKEVVSEKNWQELHNHWNETEVIEIVMLVGHYRMLAGFLNSTGLQLESPIEARLQDFYARVTLMAPP